MFLAYLLQTFLWFTGRHLLIAPKFKIIIFKDIDIG